MNLKSRSSKIEILRMMKAKSTRALGTAHEKLVEKELACDNAHRSKSSGASFHDPIDITTDHFVIECEATEHKSARITASFWEEVKHKNYGNRMPAVSVQMVSTDGLRKYTLVALDVKDLALLLGPQ